jgi:DNA-binding NarL/FixJ family response regulator
MAEGRSNHAIASHLFVTEYTVEKHIKNIFAALLLAPSPTDHRRVLAVLTYLAATTTGEPHHNIGAAITI